MIEELFKEFEFNEKIENPILEINGITLPNDYINFIKKHNGGEGNVGESAYLHFYKLEELEECNKSYDIKKYISNFVIIGSDGGGMLLGYNEKTQTYYAVDACSIDDNDKFYESKTFEEFIRNLDKN